MVLSSLPLLTLEQFLAVKPEHYHECLGELSHDFTCATGLDASFRFHYVLPDGDGQPKFEYLADMLVGYIVNYCFSAKKLHTLTPYESSRLFMQARELFRKNSHSGQAGEILIYFLLEAVLSATQVLQKMPIVTNPADERKGGDGLHAKWNPDVQLLDVFFSESKLHQNFSGAIRSAFKSMEEFHAAAMRKHEYFLTTHNMGMLDSNAQQELTEFFMGKAGRNIRTNHACLVGFDWDEYKCLDDLRRKQFLAEFEVRYRAEAARIKDNINALLNTSSLNRFRLHFFLVPFKSVEQFRDWFLKALSG